MLMYPDHFRADSIWDIICWFSSFWHHFETCYICNFRTFSWEHKRGNGLNFGMLVYPDHFQNLLNFGHRLLIFLILASFWLSETGQIWGLWQLSSECMGGIACNLTCWCILTSFSTAYFLWHGLLIFLILAGIWLSQTSHICSFQAFSWERIGGIVWTNLVIFEEMEKANFNILKSSRHPLVGIPDWCVVRLF